MASYYVNKNEQQNGDHEVHKSGCYWLSLAKDTTYLGGFDSCHGAVTEAKKYYPYTANGCATCSPDCNTG